MSGGTLGRGLFSFIPSILYSLLSPVYWISPRPFFSFFYFNPLVFLSPVLFFVLTPFYSQIANEAQIYTINDVVVDEGDPWDVVNEILPVDPKSKSWQCE